MSIHLPQSLYSCVYIYITNRNRCIAIFDLVQLNEHHKQFSTPKVINTKNQTSCTYYFISPIFYKLKRLVVRGKG